MVVEAVLMGSVSLWVGWLLYRAITRGRVPVTMGGLNATRQDTPIIFWGFTILTAVIFLYVFTSFLDILGLRVSLPRV